MYISSFFFSTYAIKIKKGVHRSKFENRYGAEHPVIPMGFRQIEENKECAK